MSHLKACVASSIRVFRNMVLIIRPNITYKFGKILCNFTPHYASAVQISHHQVDVGYTKKRIKWQLPPFGLL
jgi:hypothetical protein